LPGVLSGEQIRDRIASGTALIAGWLDLDHQIQPNGFDLTLAEIHRFASAGRVAVANRDRELPALEPIDWDEAGYVQLAPGPYHIVYNETVHLPLDLMALGRPRSSLGRCGATIQTAVWDAGYHGRSTSLLVVANPHGFALQRGARVTQLVFFKLARPAGAGYAGAYQGENVAGTGGQGR